MNICDTILCFAYRNVVPGRPVAIRCWGDSQTAGGQFDEVKSRSEIV